jgi:hypothetical protein
MIRAISASCADGTVANVQGVQKNTRACFSRGFSEHALAKAEQAEEKRRGELG